jgi:hypothetical protein
VVGFLPLPIIINSLKTYSKVISIINFEIGLAYTGIEIEYGRGHRRQDPNQHNGSPCSAWALIALPLIHEPNTSGQPLTLLNRQDIPFHWNILPVIFKSYRSRRVFEHRQRVFVSCSLICHACIFIVQPAAEKSTCRCWLGKRPYHLRRGNLRSTSGR